jgi:hypothetical protein
MGKKRECAVVQTVNGRVNAQIPSAVSARQRVTRRSEKRCTQFDIAQGIDQPPGRERRKNHDLGARPGGSQSKRVTLLDPGGRVIRFLVRHLHGSDPQHTGCDR